MYDQQVANLMERKVLSAAPGTTVASAAKRMAERNVGAILVCTEGRLVGILTERDVLHRVVARGLDPASTKLSEVMTSDPYTVDGKTPLGYALVLMEENRFRHLPVLQDGKIVGVISARSAMDPELEEFRSEQLRRQYWRNAVRREAAARAAAQVLAEAQQDK